MVDINIDLTLDADDDEISPELDPFIFIAIGDDDGDGTHLSMRSAYLSPEDVIAVLEEMADAVREILDEEEAEND